MFQEGLNVSSEMGETWIMQQSLVNLGFSKFALNEVAESTEYFLRALCLASEANQIQCILDSLAVMAWISAREGQEEVAMNLVARVEKHPAVTWDTKTRAEDLRLELETQLPHKSQSHKHARMKKPLNLLWKNYSDNQNVFGLLN